MSRQKFERIINEAMNAQTGIWIETLELMASKIPDGMTAQQAIEVMIRSMRKHVDRNAFSPPCGGDAA